MLRAPKLCPEPFRRKESTDANVVSRVLLGRKLNHPNLPAIDHARKGRRALSESCEGAHRRGMREEEDWPLWTKDIREVQDERDEGAQWP